MRERSKEEQKRLRCCRGPSLFASGLTNGRRGGGGRGNKRKREVEEIGQRQEERGDRSEEEGSR